MIEWQRKEAGYYESIDNRFLIMKTYDRIYGNHWVLHDKNIDDYYKRQYHEDTLRDCKLKAEALKQ